MDEHEIMEKVAKGLDSQHGWNAEVVATGGGIDCILVFCGAIAEHKVYLWGTANETWGADVYASEAAYDDGENEGALDTTIPSDSSDLGAVVEAMHAAMMAYEFPAV